MAKVDVPVTVTIVYGDAFSDAARRFVEGADAIANATLGPPLPNVYSCVFHGEVFGDGGSCKQCNAEMAKASRPATTATMDAACSQAVQNIIGDWQDEPTQPSGKYPMGETTLPTCSGNGSFSAGEVFDVGASKDAVIALYFPKPGEPAPSHGDVVGPRQWHIVMDGGHCGDADCERCDPLDRMVDGLTVRETLARYQTRMNEAHALRDYDEDHWDMKHDCVIPLPLGNAEWERESWFPRGFRLNDTQLAAAKQVWSLELKRKQQEAREKERCVVCVDDDRWEP